MTTYAWPAFCVNEFSMWVRSNNYVFTGPYAPSVQVLDVLGERWQVTLSTTPGNTREASGERQAFWNKLLGQVHRISLWDLARPLPLGTMRGGYTVNVVNGSLAAVTVVNGSLQPVTVIGGSPSVAVAAARGASSITMRGQSGRTLLPGDKLGINGQLVEVSAPVTFSVGNEAVVEFVPRLRYPLPAYTAITFDKPTATFMLMAADGVPIVNRPAKVYDGSAIELIETYTV